jgi:hypothetical protein
MRLIYLHKQQAASSGILFLAVLSDGKPTLILESKLKT